MESDGEKEGWRERVMGRRRGRERVMGRRLVVGEGLDALP